jgi:hypothetical protein
MKLDKTQDYGLLLNGDIKLHRLYFKQMVKLLGINCQYMAPKNTKDYSKLGDLEASYQPAITVGCIFQEHPDQKTLKKMGWVAELQEGSSIIHVPYDLEGLQAGALFSIPSGLDTAKARLFRVINMQNIMVYPASIACELALEYIDTDEPSQIQDFKQNNFTVLVDYEDDD